MKSLYTSVLLASLLAGSFTAFSQNPLYSSFPSASAVIFLDFDGQTINGTSWNSSGPIVCGPSNLSSTQITEIYNRIAEDYRPFNINITTDSTLYHAAPADRRMRVIFTITNDWYGNGAGGVAYTASFTWGDNTPCFVFTKLLGYNTKNSAEAGAHEAGHTLGLRHQAAYDANCNLVSTYNYGVGTGEISWAPIMGVGYSRNFTTWHNGPNPFGCENTQSDLDIITKAANGFGFRTDDYAESFTDAAGLNFADSQSAINGTITTAADKDFFKVTLPTAKRLKLNALPTSVGAGNAGSNVDLMVQLYDQAQKPIGTYSPEQTVSVAIDTTLNAGVYYVQLNGTGNQYVSSYGSIGSYTLLAEQIPAIVLNVHTLEIKGFSENGFHKLSWSVTADEKLISQVLEVSTDGKEFSPLNAALNADERSFKHHPDKAGIIFYRVLATFANNQQYYTNIIALRSNGGFGKPKLLTNIVRSNTLSVNSPSNFYYTVHDYSGRSLVKGQVKEGSTSINTNHLSAGTYMIRFTKGDDQYIEKFIKQ